jgi:predicted CopG family antitoxin
MPKLIRVNDSVYRELANYGKWQETMSDIIARLLLESRGSRISSESNLDSSTNRGGIRENGRTA